MAEQVQFELVSPEKILLSESVDMVVVPGGEGDFGVLPGHSPLISALRPGLIEVYTGDKVVERIFVAGGFAEVTSERCTVLADDAVTVSALDRAAIEAELTGINDRLPVLREAADKGGEAEAAQLRAGERAFAVATAKLNVIG
jgi:F-type H+-transporting ATPase subunit epsilon